jgi:hypothetical protein
MHPGTDVMTRLCKHTRQIWFKKNRATRNPHVAYVRRQTCDVEHMDFCNKLEQEIHQSPEFQLSCWSAFKIERRLLQPKVEEVVQTIMRKLNEEAEKDFIIEVKDTGLIVRHETQGRQRARPKKLHKTLTKSHWCLYFRMLFLPTTMTGRCDRLPTISSKKLSMRTPWKPGKIVHVLRSRRGLHALAHHIGDEPPPKNAFCWFLTGEALPNHRVQIRDLNLDHPYACLETGVYKACFSDVFSWGAAAPTLWP